MSDGIGLSNEAEFMEAFLQRGRLINKSLQEDFRDQGKGIMRTVLKITPPASSTKMNVTDAKRQGENAIARNMRRVMQPVKLKGVRTITKFFGKPAEDFGGPWTVPTKEKWPNISRLYEYTGGRVREGKRTGRRAMYYVDERKFKKELKRRQKGVGTLMAGAGLTGQNLGVGVPAFARRNISRVPPLKRKTLTGDLKAIVLTLENTVGWASRSKGLRRRIDWAVRDQSRKMVRQMPYLISAAARRSRRR